MANVKDKAERDFRLVSAPAQKPVDFNKLKVGKNYLNGDLTAIVKDFNERQRRYLKVYDRDFVEDAIQKHDIKKLRLISDHFYQTSGIYSRLCRYMSFLYKYDWFVTPHKYDDKISPAKVLEGWTKSVVFLENCKLKKLFGEIALEVIKNGCYYGYIVQTKTSATIQKLPANYCRSRFKVNGQYAVEFNIRFFDDYFENNQYRLDVLKSFPKEFQKAYLLYKQGKLPRLYTGDTLGWFLLNPSCSVKFNLSDSDAPLFVPIIPALLDLEDAKKLDKDKMAQQLLKIIIQKMPIDRNGDLIFDVDEAQALHNNVVRMIGDAIGVDVMTTFADVDVADLSDRSNVSSVDSLERVERSVYNEAGVSQLQFNTDGNIALEKSIANDEATMMNLVLQFEEFAERLLVPFNKNTRRLKYSFRILPTTIYNFKELSKVYKEQTQLGFSKVLPQVALGHLQSEIIANALFENKIMNLNELFVAPQMSSTMSGGNKASSSSSNSSNGPGRPELPDDQKSSKTIQNKESAN